MEHASATGGTPFNFTVTALDPFNNTATGYGGTVHFTSSDGAAALPANSTLTNGTGTFTAGTTLTTGVSNAIAVAVNNGVATLTRRSRACGCVGVWSS